MAEMMIQNLKFRLHKTDSIQPAESTARSDNAAKNDTQRFL